MKILNILSLLRNIGGKTCLYGSIRRFFHFRSNYAMFFIVNINNLLEIDERKLSEKFNIVQAKDTHTHDTKEIIAFFQDKLLEHYNKT
jgi:hypothetical protein